MIYLPKDYAKWVQVRKFIEPINALGAHAILVFLVQNDAGQLWYQDWSVVVPGLSKVLNSEENYRANCERVLKQAFEAFTKNIKEKAMETNKVVRANNNEAVSKVGGFTEIDYDSDPIDDNWFPVWNHMLLEKYSDYIETLK